MDGKYSLFEGADRKRIDSSPNHSNSSSPASSSRSSSASSSPWSQQSMSLVGFWDDYHVPISFGNVDKRYMEAQHKRLGFVVYATEYGLYDRNGKQLGTAKLQRLAEDCVPRYPSELTVTKNGQEVMESKLQCLSAAALAPLDDTGRIAQGIALMRAQGMVYEKTADRLLSLKVVPIENVIVGMSEMDGTIHVRNARTLEEAAIVFQWAARALGREWSDPRTDLSLDVDMTGVVRVPDTPPSSSSRQMSHKKAFAEALQKQQDEALQRRLQQEEKDWQSFWNDPHDDTVQQIQHMIGNGQARAEAMMKDGKRQSSPTSSNASASSKLKFPPIGSNSDAN